MPNQETIFLHFNPDGQLIEALITDTAPDQDWVQAPADYQMGDVVQLVDNKVVPLDDSQQQAQALALSKTHATEQVKQFAANTRAQMANYADAYQLAGWNEKVRRAEKILAKTATPEDIAIVQAECVQRGKNETPDQLATLQIAKANQLATAVAVIDGMESRALADVANAQDQPALDALLADLQTQAQQALQQLTAA